MKKTWIIVTVLTIVIALVGFNIWNHTKMTNTSVKVTSLKKEKMTETVIIPGEVMLKNEQYVYRQAGKGEIEEVFVKAGDTVKKGEKLIKYKNKELELRKKQNQLQINLAYLELDGLRKQHQNIDRELDKDPDNEMIQDEHDQIKMEQQRKNIELEQALLEKDSIEQSMERLTVIADVDGTVLSVNEQSSSQEQIAEEVIIQIGSLDDVVVETAVSEYDILKVIKGQSVELTSDVFPDEKWHGSISYISDLPKKQGVDGVKREEGVTYSIEVDLEDDVKLKPGFKMLIEIITSDKNVNILPISSVLQKDDKNYVYLVKGGKSIRAEVEIGSVNSEKVEIKSGILEEDNVIIDPSDNIRNGMDVTIE